MHNGIMPYGNMVPYDGLGALISAVNHGSILDINAVPDPDTVYISPQHRIEPDAAFITHNNIANNSGIGSNKTVLSPFGKILFYR
jgi:hypothetical protein